ncbi:MAG: nuclear transport factor 2 family protein [Myxococcota bacterium]
MNHRLRSVCVPSSLFVAVLILSGCASHSTGEANMGAALEARLTRLEAEADRQEIERLMHAYAHGIDSMDMDLLRRTFAPDARAEYRGLNFPMHEDLAGVEQIIGWLNKSVGGRKKGEPWHYMSTHLIELEPGADEATLQTFQHNRTMGGIGVYTLNAIRTPQGWRIKKLRLEERILDDALLKRLNSSAP